MTAIKNSHHSKINREDDAEGGESGQGGQSGHIEFTDFLGSGEHTRSKKLPYSEERRLLSVHGDLAESLIKKQKEQRDFNKSIKHLDKKKHKGLGHQRGHGQGGEQFESRVEAHPLLSKRNGIQDKKVSWNTETMDMITNPGPRQELQLQLSQQPKMGHANQLTKTYTNTPKNRPG